MRSAPQSCLSPDDTPPKVTYMLNRVRLFVPALALAVGVAACGGGASA
jgi:hypothetical protein